MSAVGGWTNNVRSKEKGGRKRSCRLTFRGRGASLGARAARPPNFKWPPGRVARSPPALRKGVGALATSQRGKIPHLQKLKVLHGRKAHPKVPDCSFECRGRNARVPWTTILTSHFWCTPAAVRGENKRWKTGAEVRKTGAKPPIVSCHGGGPEGNEKGAAEAAPFRGGDEGQPLRFWKSAMKEIKASTAATGQAL